MPLRAPARLASAILLGAALHGSPLAALEQSAAPAEAVRWLAPAPATTLVAGTRARFAWEPGRAYFRLGAIEEWELFLSYDGGRSWPVRLTPHLEASLREVEVALPDLPSADARLLLRLGDERRELDLELPGTYRIVRDPARAGPSKLVDGPLLLRPVRGESARPGEPGAALWSEGSRRGQGIEWVALDDSRAGWSGSSLRDGRSPQPLFTARRAPSRIAAVPVALSFRFDGAPAPHAVVPRAPTPALSPRLQTGRRNE